MIDLLGGKTNRKANTKTNCVQDISPVNIVIGGGAVPKGRPRMTRRGHVYTPAATRDYERTVGWAAKAAMAGRQPITGAVKLAAVFELPIPPSWSKTRHANAIAGIIRPTNKPDTDNLVKSLLDGIAGIVISGDEIVTDIHARKRYSSDPKSIVVVTPLNEEELA